MTALKQKIAISAEIGQYRDFEIYQARNGYYFALSISGDYLDVDGCETIEECKADIDATMDGIEEVEA